METRKIKIYTTLGSPGTVETNVTTLGDLRPLLSDRGIDVGGMKLLVGETRNELSEDVAILPEGDFKLYLVPAKTKSGATSTVEKLEMLANLFGTAKRLLEDIASDFEVETVKAGLTKEEQEAAEEIKNIVASRSVDNWVDEDEDYEDEDKWDN